MNDALSSAAPSRRRGVLLFLLAVGCLGAAGGIFESTFNNYLDDTFRIGAQARGFLEFPREFPGFMVTLVSGVLFFLGEAHLAVLAAGLTGLGLAGLGLLSDTYSWMLVWMVVWSTGMHLMMPTQESIALELAKGEKRGEMLGKVGAVSSLAMVIGCLFVWSNFSFLGRSYAVTFVAAAVSAGAASALDDDLMERGDIIPFEKILIVDNTNGARVETFAARGERGSGVGHPLASANRRDRHPAASETHLPSTVLAVLSPEHPFWSSQANLHHFRGVGAHQSLRAANSDHRHPLDSYDHRKRGVPPRARPSH